MTRVNATASVIAAVGVLAGLSVAQETQPAAESEVALRIERAKTVITDTGASPEVRRIGAEALFELDQPAAIDAAIDILRSNGDPQPRIAVCQAAAAVSRRAPSLLDERLVGPLLELLGDADEVLRAATAEVLASFPDGQVAQELGNLAADASAPLMQRLTAVDALALIVDRRQIVQQLILLLDSESVEVRAGVRAALRPASRVDHGADVERWKQWWREKSALDETGWLLDRVQLFKHRNRELQEAADRQRATTELQRTDLARQLHHELESVYRLTPPPQRDDLIAGWLADPQVVYRTAAVARIAANISDGNPPSDAVRTALAQRLGDESPEVRRGVLDVVAALGDPAFGEAVRGRLEAEKVPAVREAILYSLGRLQDPSAFRPLVAELTNPDATQGCLVETASSINLLASQGKVSAEDIAAAVGPLKESLAASPSEAVRVQAALLGAMASIGASEFTEVFLANLDRDEPDLLLPALDGVRRVGDGSRIDRVYALAAHSDARVRRRAFEALGTLGGTEHLEAMASRLTPAVEPNDAVRQAAWLAFCSILKPQSSETRLQWVGRLEDLPERQEAYLTKLTADLCGSQAAQPECVAARRRLAELYDGQARFGESLPLWRELWESQHAANPAAAAPIGLRCLRATLETHRYEKIDEFIATLMDGSAEADKGEIEGELLAHLEALRSAEDGAHQLAYLEALDRLPPDTFTPRFYESLAAARNPPATPAPEADAEPRQG